MRRVVVPLLPQSSGSVGDRSNFVPAPVTVKSADNGGMPAPIDRSTAAVLRTSADSRMLEIRDFPRASAERMRAR
jgi:hypothetical protein